MCKFRQAGPLDDWGQGVWGLYSHHVGPGEITYIVLNLILEIHNNFSVTIRTFRQIVGGYSNTLLGEF